MGMEGGWGGLYRYPHQPIPGPIFSIYLALRAYPRPNEGNSMLFYEVSMRFPRMGLELTSFDLRIDPQIDLPDRSPDGPEMSPDDPR